MKERITYYDSLRGLAIIGVVFIHTIKYQDPAFLNAEIIFRQIINFSVPLFLALSGFFLAEKQIQNKEQYFHFLKKQIPRVYLPYFLWSLLYIFIGIAKTKEFSIAQTLLNLLIFQTIPIFYYVGLIIQYYLLLPFFQKHLSHKLLGLSVFISIISCAIIFSIQYFTHYSIPLILYAGNGFTWVMFFILGMYLRVHKFNISKPLVFLMVLVSLGLSIIETFWSWNLLGSIGNAISAVKISSFIYSAFIIILLLNFRVPKTKIFNDLGKVSYAVYLLHILVLMFITKLVLYFKLPYNSFYIELFIGSLTILSSYLICITLRMINKNLASKYLGI
ncbi:acyltransferase [Epilithonimonas hominis]|uniref:acyltransferase n=1 Tax=Epilithonimonas hominis TaxID=420404 RepID=UPI000EC112D0|nr:acyltransferase [Epilithonimonas hominis]HAP96716.1 hypothetical protein [Chryseobacterium sp.]